MLLLAWLPLGNPKMLGRPVKLAGLAIELYHPGEPHCLYLAAPMLADHSQVGGLLWLPEGNLFMAWVRWGPACWEAVETYQQALPRMGTIRLYTEEAGWGKLAWGRLYKGEEDCFIKFMARHTLPDSPQIIRTFRSGPT